MTRREVSDNLIEYGNNKYSAFDVYTYAPNVESAIGRLLAKLIRKRDVENTN